MKFGKLENIKNVDFTLPPDDGGTAFLLSKLPKNQALPLVFVGCTGWSMKEWVGKVYPKGTKPNRFLHHYAKQFNTIELNTTHYRIPTSSIIENWQQSVPSDFHFCPKIPQSISHSRDLGRQSGAVHSFCEAIYGLGEQLGCSFMQMPPYFEVSRLPLLSRFLKEFPKEVPLAVEVRHQTWFSEPTNFNALFDLLESENITAVITDVAGRRDVLHQRLTTNTAMIRFVGNGLDKTDYQRIDDWVLRLKNWFQNGLKQVYFFTHEPDNILAPELSEYFVKKINESFKAIIRGPKLFDDQAGQQISLF